MGCIRLLFIFISLLLSWTSSGASLTGKITDEKGQPLPFVSIYVKGTTNGTTSNMDGVYSLELVPGTYQVLYKIVGYTMHPETLVLSPAGVLLNVQLKPEISQLKEVTVKADAEDPAYAIIRGAIKKRKYYLEQVDAYSCDVYIKGEQRITKHPNKIFGQKVDFGELDSTTGIVYLSESVSKFNFKQPDKIKEEMISSKVSGDNKAFSYNQASDMLFNFYENNMEVDGLSERGFVSPIANNALFFYRYHLVGTFVENDQLINKIEVIPKRAHDPVFRGYIYIMEDSWRIHGTDLYLTKDAQIDFVDTLIINQVYLPVEPEIWLPFSNKYIFDFSIFGIKGNGVYIGINKNYLLHPDFTKKFFNGEVMKVNEDANKKDTVYWKDTRPIPLTAEEIKDYRKRDSLQRIHESKPYLDSIDRKNNKFGFSNVLFGYNYYQRYKKQTWNMAPLIQSIGFNTVQGLNAGLVLSYKKDYEKNKNLSLNTSAGYGFSNQRWLGNASVVYLYRPEKFAYFSLGGGVQCTQFNSDAISPFLNTLYTLLEDQNFMKLYQKKSIHASHSSELVNGLVLVVGTEYSNRSPLMNTSGYKLVNMDSREYTSNDPVYPQNDFVPSFHSSQLLSAWLQLQIHIGQKYYTRPNEKIILGSKYPAFVIDYKKAAGGYTGVNEEYDFVKLTMSDKIKLNLFGTSQYSISAGKFLSQKNMEFMDYYHFNGNQTLFSTFTLNSFDLLDYYKYSTTGAFIEAHYEHNFGGFILNKFPLIRRLKLDEIVGVNYLSSNTLPEYFEFFFGIEKFQFLRVDFVMAYSKNTQTGTGIRIGLKF